MEAQFDSAISSTMAPTASTTSTTSARNEELIPLYLRQLHNYAYASEHAAPCCLSLKPVSKLRLLVFGPGAFVHRRERQIRSGRRAGTSEIGERRLDPAPASRQSIAPFLAGPRAFGTGSHPRGKGSQAGGNDRARRVRAAPAA